MEFFAALLIVESAHRLSGLQTCDLAMRWPHDTTAFTQGLLYSAGHLTESTGLFGKSELRTLELLTGQVKRSIRLPSNRFGEGLAQVNDKFVQLTWRSGVAYVYDVASLGVMDSLSIAGEAWGLTFDGTRLVMSDGTSSLRFLDPNTGEVLDYRNVKFGEREVRGLNELESVRSEIWANVYPTDSIAKIDPNTGVVTGWLVLSALPGLPRLSGQRTFPANGIAYSQERDLVFVTGKNWPWIYGLRHC